MLCSDTYKIIIVVIILIILLIIKKYYCEKPYDQNEHFNNEKMCIVQYDNRKELPKDLQKLVDFNREYCKKRPYIDFVYQNDHNISPYWMKVKLVKDKLNEIYHLKEKYKYVMWLDTDATVINVKDNLIDFIEKYMKDKDVLVSSDMPPWFGLFNAGVFIFKNTITGRKIIQDWLALYDNKKWVFGTDQKWKCRGCRWADENYEQGSFAKYIIPKYRNNIKIVSWIVLNNPNYSPYKYNVVYHFANRHKSNIKNVRKV